MGFVKYYWWCKYSKADKCNWYLVWNWCFLLVWNHGGFQLPKITSDPCDFYRRYHLYWNELLFGTKEDNPIVENQKGYLRSLWSHSWRSVKLIGKSGWSGSLLHYAGHFALPPTILCFQEVFKQYFTFFCYCQLCFRYWTQYVQYCYSMSPCFTWLFWSPVNLPRLAH